MTKPKNSLAKAIVRRPPPEDPLRTKAGKAGLRRLAREQRVIQKLAGVPEKKA